LFIVNVFQNKKIQLMKDAVKVLDLAKMGNVVVIMVDVEKQINIVILK